MLSNLHVNAAKIYLLQQPGDKKLIIKDFIQMFVGSVLFRSSCTKKQQQQEGFLFSFVMNMATALIFLTSVRLRRSFVKKILFHRVTTSLPIQSCAPSCG